MKSVSRDQTKTASSTRRGARWFAVYTRARAEKRVESLLERKGIESFLPVAPLIRTWHDRRIIVNWPLFPSYVFSRVSPQSVLHLLETPGVADVVRMNGRPAEIPPEEIENVARLAAALEPGDELPVMVTLERGDTVRIQSGTFQGVEGIVLECRGARRVLVGLKSIGIGFEVNVPIRAIRRL